jgi:hypothetical protein
MANDDGGQGTTETTPNGRGKTGGSDRKELLLKMYDQMFNDINTHIIVVWQSIGVLVGAFAVLALVERNIISVDIGTSLILLLCGWLLANLLDSSYWYNRNLAIIANIERQFLLTSDLREIHYYFGAHRPSNKMITHLRIQRALGVGIGLLVLLFHFNTRVFGGLGAPWSNFEFQRSLPYVIATAVLIYVIHVKKHRDLSYAEFIQRSPGKLIDTSGIVYGEGHGFPPTSTRPETENRR